MDHATAAQLIGGGQGLGYNSKMPGATYGLPISACKTGQRLMQVPGTTCAQCYCKRSHYTYPTVRARGLSRLRSIRNKRWAEAMAWLINETDGRHFRWHDSGDLQSVGHLAKIVEVCKLTPGVKHWLPTREYSIVETFVKQGGVFPGNLIVRLSAHIVDGPLPVGLAARLGVQVSGVHKDQPALGSICEARTRGNVCGPCRACWNPEIFAISYPKH